jgi:hypothetical protein
MKIIVKDSYMDGSCKITDLDSNSIKLPVYGTVSEWVIKLSESSLHVDTLIDVLLHLNTCCSRWPSRTHVINCQCLASFKSAYTLINFPPANTGNAVHCYLSVNSTSLHTSDHKLIFFWCILPMENCVERVTVLSLI